MAGDTLSLNVQHPEVGSRELYIKSDEDINLTLGGYTNELTPTGKPGKTSTKKTRKLGTLTGLQVFEDKDENNLEFIQKIANSHENATFTWEHVDGMIYVFDGNFTGDIAFESNGGFITCEVTAVSEIRKQA